MTIISNHHKEIFEKSHYSEFLNSYDSKIKFLQTLD